MMYIVYLFSVTFAIKIVVIYGKIYGVKEDAPSKIPTGILKPYLLNVEQTQHVG